MTERARPGAAPGPVLALPAAALLVALAVVPAPAGPAVRTVPLFHIERSKNANIVHYDARLTEQGELDPEKPVEAYWMVHTARKPHRDELNFVERVKAYGFEMEKRTLDGPYLMTLAAYPEREITVYVEDGQPMAELIIAGKPSFLEKLYINSTEGLILPKVNYVELFGRDVSTGEPRYEKIVPR